MPIPAPEILVVDDEESVRTLVVRTLEEEQYVVHQARHGLDALSVLSVAPRVGLVVSDVFMPEMDGYELGRRLAERWPDLPVLYISGYLHADELPLEPDGRPRRFLRKPFRPDELVREVQAIVPVPTPAIPPR
jgi:two-component system, cell cycle sensor histidine kinase and response regulator CckA